MTPQVIITGRTSIQIVHHLVRDGSTLRDVFILRGYRSMATGPAIVTDDRREVTASATIELVHWTRAAAVPSHYAWDAGYDSLDELVAKMGDGPVTVVELRY